MDFAEFCRVHGLIVDHVQSGRWIRVATVDHPRTKNGAYKWLGDVGFVQNHATMVEVATWRDKSPDLVKTQAIAREVKALEAKVANGWRKASQKASELIRMCVQSEHPYLTIKGFPKERGLVSGDGSLVIPMRDWRSGELAGAQVIRWIPEELKYEKKMLFGMRAKGAIFRMGPPRSRRTWLVEGYATALSVQAAIAVCRLSDAVVVCFSAGNLKHMASCLTGDVRIFADNDASGTGERIARETGLPWVMSDVVGHDANDMHKAEGIWAVAQRMTEAVPVAA